MHSTAGGDDESPNGKLVKDKREKEMREGSTHDPRLNVKNQDVDVHCVMKKKKKIKDQVCLGKRTFRSFFSAFRSVARVFTCARARAHVCVCVCVCYACVSLSLIVSLQFVATEPVHIL